jgi:hypothetical protein
LWLGHAQKKTSSTPGTSATTPAALAPITVAAPPANPAADAPCTKLLGALPIRLNGLSGRPARSSWTYVAAWGDPAVVLRCGVPRPAELAPGSGAFAPAINGVTYLRNAHGNSNVFTAVDRAVYIEVTVPNTYAGGPLPSISDAITKTLPAVCVVDPNETDASKLCTHRP